MKNVLTNPNGFFSELSIKDINLKNSFLIVLIVATIEVIDTMLIVNSMTSTLSGYETQFVNIIKAIFAIKELIVHFIWWFIYAGIFYAISTLFGGTGSFKRVFEFVGYGFIPMIIVSLIGLIVTIIVLPTIELSIENVELMKETLMQNKLMEMSSIISIPLQLWSAIIWIFGIKYARNISTKHSVMTVGIPVGIGLTCTIIARFFMFDSLLSMAL